MLVGVGQKGDEEKNWEREIRKKREGKEEVRVGRQRIRGRGNEFLPCNQEDCLVTSVCGLRVSALSAGAAHPSSARPGTRTPTAMNILQLYRISGLFSYPISGRI